MNIPDLAGATEKRDAAYEIKFIVATVTAELALEWARQNLLPDPHAEASRDGYRVNSLYFDTPNLDVFQRNGSYGKAKYRVRRYGQEGSIFLERKLKARGLVSKRRTRIPDEDLLLLVDSGSIPGWAGHWFRRRLMARQLVPHYQIQYQRVARVGMTAEGPVRFTLDRDIASFQTCEYRVREEGPWKPLFSDQCILELKFRDALPPLFQSFVNELKLTPQPVSKYRLSVQAASATLPMPDGGALRTNGHAAVDELLGNRQTQGIRVNANDRVEES